MSARKKVKELLRKDDAYLKYRTILEHCRNLAEFDNLVSELETMHKSRKSRDLHLRTPDVHKLIEATMQASAFRSRCVEIMNTVQKANRLLQAATDRIEVHTATTYRDYIPGRSQQERKAYVKNIYQSGHYKLADYDRIIEMAKLLIEDVDQFGWSARLILNSLELIYQRENIIGQGKNL